MGHHDGSGRMQEVTAAQALVEEVVVCQLAEVAGVPQTRARVQLHCRALGSFCRGKAETGDVDMMVVPGDHLADVCTRCVQALCSGNAPVSSGNTGPLCLSPGPASPRLSTSHRLHRTYIPPPANPHPERTQHPCLPEVWQAIPATAPC